MMNNQKEGDYLVTMNGTTISGKTITQENTIPLKPYTAPVIIESIRYKVTYEYNETKSIVIHDKYITKLVAHKIFQNFTAFVSGY